jgi:hypothetical protein
MLKENDVAIGGTEGVVECEGSRVYNGRVSKIDCVADDSLNSARPWVYMHTPSAKKVFPKA